MGVDALLLEVGRDTQKPRLEVGDLQRVDPPEVEAHPGLLLHRLDMAEEVLVAGGEDADHPEVR